MNARVDLELADKLDELSDRLDEAVKRIGELENGREHRHSMWPVTDGPDSAIDVTKR